MLRGKRFGVGRVRNQREAHGQDRARPGRRRPRVVICATSLALIAASATLAGEGSAASKFAITAVEGAAVAHSTGGAAPFTYEGTFKTKFVPSQIAAGEPLTFIASSSVLERKGANYPGCEDGTTNSESVSPVLYMWRVSPASNIWTNGSRLYLQPHGTETLLNTDFYPYKSTTVITCPDRRVSSRMTVPITAEQSASLAPGCYQSETQDTLPPLGTYPTSGLTGTISTLTVGRDRNCDRKAPPIPDCSDNVDNDHDRQIDYPKDHGCYSKKDDSEAGDCRQVLNLVLSGSMERPPETKCLHWSKPKPHKGRPDGGSPSMGCDYDNRPGQVSTAYNEVSAADSRAPTDRRVIEKCRDWHPKGEPAPDHFFIYYGYDAGYSPPYGFSGHGTGNPNRAGHFLEIYGRHGSSFDLVTPRAEAIWRDRKDSYSPMINIGSPLANKAGVVAEVKALCRGHRSIVYRKGYGMLGLYSGSSYRDIADKRTPGIYDELADCLKALNAP